MANKTRFMICVIIVHVIGNNYRDCYVTTNKIRTSGTEPRQNIVAATKSSRAMCFLPCSSVNRPWHREKDGGGLAKRAEKMPLGNKRRHASERGTERKGRYTRMVHTTFGLSIRGRTFVETWFAVDVPCLRSSSICISLGFEFRNEIPDTRAVVDSAKNSSIDDTRISWLYHL